MKNIRQEIYDLLVYSVEPSFKEADVWKLVDMIAVLMHEIVPKKDPYLNLRGKIETIDETHKRIDKL